MNIKKNGTRKFGFFAENEFKLSGMQGENYSAFELDRRCIAVANFVRLKVGSAVKINSCGRTPLYNASLDGSSPKSQHLIIPSRPVRATDLHPVKISVSKFQQLIIDNMKVLRLLGVRGVGFYSWGVHLDVRKQDNMSVWGTDSNTKKKIKETRGLFNF